MSKRKPLEIPIDVVDGQSIIEVVGDCDASMLLLAGDVAAVGGDDGSGSVGMLAARAGPDGPGSAEVKSLVEWLADPDLSLDTGTGWAGPPDPDRLSPLLQLLRPGRYVMTAHVPHQPPLVIDQLARWYDDEEIVLVPTDTWPPRDHAAVQRYRSQIQNGRSWPAVVALSPVPDCEIGYLLDGHHKLAAYRQAGLSPLLLRLAPERPFRPRLDDLRPTTDPFLAAAAHLFGDLRDQALRLGSWAGWLAEHGRLEDAAAEYRTDLANTRRLIARSSRTATADLDRHRVEMTAIQHRYGVLLRAMGRPAEAEEELRSALAVRRRALGDDDPATWEIRRALDG